jgi:hypothetical protein
MTEDREYQNDLLKDFCWQLVTESELYGVSKNSELDEKAEALFIKLRSAANDWLIEAEAAEAMKEVA